MDKTNIGSWIRTQSYKHDGSLHRTWDNMMIIDANEDYIVTGSCASRVVECDGRIWYTKEPAVSIYFKPMLSILPYNTRKKLKKTAAAPGTPFFSPYILCPVAYTLFYRSPFYTPIFL